MRKFEVIFLFLIIIMAFSSKWSIDISIISMISLSIIFILKLIHEYFFKNQDIKRNLFYGLTNIYYRSLFIVGLFFITFNYAGKDIISSVFVILSLLFMIFAFLKDKKKEKVSVFVYFRTYILLYFTFSWVFY
jgi:hypothetical protein